MNYLKVSIKLWQFFLKITRKSIFSTSSTIAVIETPGPPLPVSARRFRCRRRCIAQGLRARFAGRKHWVTALGCWGWDTSVDLDPWGGSCVLSGWVYRTYIYVNMYICIYIVYVNIYIYTYVCIYLGRLPSGACTAVALQRSTGFNVQQVASYTFQRGVQ